MNHKLIIPMLAVSSLFSDCSQKQSATEEPLQFVGIENVEITDDFWAPKLKQWSSTTANDVLNKFEVRNTFENFDKVADGCRDTHNHAGLPWFDGLVYESIRGISDLLVAYPDDVLASRLDSIVDRVALAQQSEPEGFINTYTQLTENSHRWGENGGVLRWMHDVYNSGMLIEAGVHHYKATGKTKLLEVATKVANLMSGYMGPEPKHNIVPAHSGPEEALVKLYKLYTENPELKDKVDAPVNAQSYLDLAEFWINTRGDHCGLPNWGGWGNEEAEKWIRANTYADTTLYGLHSRPTFGPYAQDSLRLAEQNTIEGHAVRATLYLTGVAAAAAADGNADYKAAGERLWENMVGRRMYVTGGVGAISFDEKFGPDYFLPSDAYLETCAAVGAGFFSQRMNELTKDAKYMDEYERVLYNGVLTGISLSGDNYTYQNPLNSQSHSRWDWHGCPCCPPMFLKFMGAMPGFVYAHSGDDIFVNLYVGSNARVATNNDVVNISQTTAYPYDGKVTIAVEPENGGVYTINLRIPGWAEGKENPFGLYESAVEGKYSVKVNGVDVDTPVTNGYASINRKWAKGDVIELELPMAPRFVTAHPEVADLQGQVAVAVGPLVYCLEGVDNDRVAELAIDTTQPLSAAVMPVVGLENTIVVRGSAVTAEGETTEFTAIPYYLLGNRTKGAPYNVWLPAKK